MTAEQILQESLQNFRHGFRHAILPAGITALASAATMFWAESTAAFTAYVLTLPVLTLGSLQMAAFAGQADPMPPLGERAKALLPRWPAQILLCAICILPYLTAAILALWAALSAMTPFQQEFEPGMQLDTSQRFILLAATAAAGTSLITLALRIQFAPLLHAEGHGFTACFEESWRRTTGFVFPMLLSCSVVLPATFLLFLAGPLGEFTGVLLTFAWQGTLHHFFGQRPRDGLSIPVHPPQPSAPPAAAAAACP